VSTEVSERASTEEQKEMEDKVTSPEKAEEAKLKPLPTAALDKTEVTGDHIPIAQDLPQWKPSLVTSKLLTD
uniref:Uncharacterized protein n=1 Tax=Panthera leo TaxID=9689 RepID=A0A8C8WF64_PANLE